MEYNDNKVFVYNEDRIAIECDIISKFENEDTGKHYLVYTDGSRNEMGTKNMYVVSYDPESKGTELTPVQSAEEWESISGFLQELMKAVEEHGLNK